jgi:hypothetical protein
MWNEDPMLPILNAAYFNFLDLSLIFCRSIIEGMISNTPIHWFDGSDQSTVTFVGNTVTGWTDKSGNGNDARSAGIQNITYNTSERGLVFNGAPGAPGYLTINNSASMFKNTPYTIFIVEKKNATTDLNIMYGMVAPTSLTANTVLFFGYRFNNVFTFAQLSNNLDVTSTSITSLTTRIWALRCPNTGSRTIRLNGAVFGSNTNVTKITGSAPVAIGYHIAANASSYYNGTIYEIVAYQDDLTDSQVQQMEGYLAWKWSLTSSLSTSHPYYFANPNVPIISKRPVVWHDGFDQSSITLSGTNTVTAWSDKSGNNRNSTTATSVITYDSTGRGLVFNGNNLATDVLATDNSAALYKNTPYTIFIVEKKNTASQSFIYGVDIGANIGTANIGFFARYVNDTSFRYSQYTTFLDYANAGLTGSIKRLWVFRLPSSGSRTIRFNGSEVATSTNIDQNDSPYSMLVGGYRENSTYFTYTGTLYEIIGYHGDFTDAEIQQNEGYLAWKWGLQASLPTSHPYRNVANNVIASIPFSPVQWFDAYASTNFVFSSGSNISTWIDRSGNGRSGAKTGAATVGYNSSERGVVFNSVSGGNVGYFVSSNSGDVYRNSAYTIFAVEKKNTNAILSFFYTTPSDVSATNQGVVLGYRLSNVMTLAQRGNDFDYTNNNLSSFTKRLWTFQNPESPLSMSIRFNGALAATHTNNIKVTSTATMLVGLYDNTYFYNGTIHEIVGYNESLSLQQIQLIEGSLAWKWGLQTDLDGTHPYKNINPNLVTPVVDPLPDVGDGSASYFWGVSNAPVTLSSFQLTLTDNLEFTTTVDLPPGSRSYTATGLTNGVSYNGNLIAYSELQTIGPAASFRTVEPGVLPSAPTSLSFTRQDSNRIVLSWNAPTSTGGSPINCYVVQNSTTTVRAGAKTSARTYVTNEISSGRQIYSLQAVNDAGYGVAAYTRPFSIPFGSFIPNIYFPLDGSLDEFSFNNTLTAFGSPQFSTNTVVGTQSLALNGSSQQYLTIDNANINWPAFTFSGWVYGTSLGTGRIFDFGNFGNNLESSFLNISDSYYYMVPLAPSGGNFQFGIKAAGQYEQTITTGVPLQNNVWTHVAVTLDGSVGRLYRNGIQIGYESITFDPADINAATYNIGTYLNGTLDELAFISTALDPSTIALIHDTGTLVGSNILSLSTVSTIITSGLTFWTDPLSKTSYGGSGATLYSQGPLNVNGTLNGSYGFSNAEGIRLSNTSGSVSLNTAALRADTLTNFRTVSAWYKTLTLPTFGYFIDARIGTANSWIYMNPFEFGTNWSTSIVYSDGDNMRRIGNSSNVFSSAGNWRNVTVVAPAAMTDNVNFFSANDNTNSLDCVFGPIQVYDRVLTREENIQNYNRYRGRYGLASVVSDGLIYRTDPVDLLSWSTGMTTMNNMVAGGVNATISGTYNDVAEFGIRFTNASADLFANVSYLKVGTLNSIRTISIWYYVVTIPAEGYLFDARLGLTNGWMIMNTNGTLQVGAAWSDALVYVNGDQESMTPSQATTSISCLGSWKNITFVLNSSRPAFNDNLTFFGIHVDPNSYAGLNARMGPVFVYNRAITAAENTENFNRYKYRYGLYVVPLGLVYHTDPLDSASYTSGVVMRNLVSGSSVSGSLSGAYSKVTYEGIRLTNTSTDFLLNTAGLTLTSLTYRAISIWYKVETGDANTFRYIFDGRPANANSFIIKNSNTAGDVAFGTFFTNATVYANGGVGQTISTTILTDMFAIGGWRNYTIVTTAAGVGVAELFFTGNQGLNCVFGPILMYDRAISQAENIQNYNTYRVRYGL